MNKGLATKGLATLLSTTPGNPYHREDKKKEYHPWYWLFNNIWFQIKWLVNIRAKRPYCPYMITNTRFGRYSRGFIFRRVGFHRGENTMALRKGTVICSKDRTVICIVSRTKRHKARIITGSFPRMWKYKFTHKGGVK